MKRPPITPSKTWHLSAEGLSQKLPGLRDAAFPSSPLARLQAAGNFPHAGLAFL